MELLKFWWVAMANSGRGILLINAVLMLVFFKRLPVALKAFGLFVLVDLMTEMLLLLVLNPKQNNMPWLHLYTLLEFVTLSVYFKAVFQDLEVFQRYFWWGLGVLTILLISNSLFVEPILGFNSNAKTLVQLMMIGYAVTYFFRSFGNTDFSQKDNLVLALINAAVLVYYSGSLFVFMFAKMVNNPSSNTGQNTQIVFWMFNAGLFLLFQSIILIALWKTIRIPAR